MSNFSRFIAPVAMAMSIFGAADASAQKDQHPRERGHYWSERFMSVYDVDRDGKVTLEEILADQGRLFHAVDTDVDSRLSPEEFRRRGHLFELFVSTSLFDLLDTNGDGKLTADELLAPARRWVARYDANGNKTIDASELPEPREGFRHGRMPPHGPRGDRPANRAEHLVRVFDTGGDGKVALSEIEDTLRTRFGQLDTNGDRALSPDEFRAGPRLRELFAAASIFDLLDADGDGQLALAEINGPTKRWFARYDANRDGAMAPDELPKPQPREERRRP